MSPAQTVAREGMKVAAAQITPAALKTELQGLTDERGSLYEPRQHAEAPEVEALGAAVHEDAAAVGVAW